MIEEVTVTKTITHLNSKQVAERYQVAPKTVQNWRTRGEGPRFLKIGKRVVYSIEELQRWEAFQLRKSTVDQGPKKVRSAR